MFLTNFVSKEDFFVDGKPVDVAIENPVTSDNPYDMFPHILLNCVGVINKNLDKKTCQEKNKEIWNSPNYSKKELEINSKLSRFQYFTGFSSYHLPQSFKKSSFDEVWKKEEMILTETSSHKFRTVYDITQYLFRYWQLESRKTVIREENNGKTFEINDNEINEIINCIKNKTYKQICMNDSREITDFESMKNLIKEAFDSILPNKSEFEI